MKFFACLGLSALVFLPAFSSAQVHLNASDLLRKASLSFSPHGGTFQAGSVFDVQTFLDTRSNSINTVELHISFPPDKLFLVRPSGDKSIIGLWLEPPKYSNTDGTASFVGIIPGGIVTNSGLISTLTFRAKAAGEAVVKVTLQSRVLMNDGLGTDAVVDYGRATYTISPKPPDGISVYSETHPIQDKWYNNNNPIIQWDKDSDSVDFSYTLDNQPFTVPDNIVDTKDALMQFPNLKDGVYFFHIKAHRNNVWGVPTHFALRIDTQPPAKFTPKADFIDSEHVLISFYTTDLLSGIDHYEVGVVDTSQPSTEAPAFVPVDSPYQLPVAPDNANVIVRAIDRAGNVQDSTLPVSPSINRLSQRYAFTLLTMLAALLLLMILHFFFGHHFIRHMERFIALWKKEEEAERHDDKI